MARVKKKPVGKTKMKMIDGVFNAMECALSAVDNPITPKHYTEMGISPVEYIEANCLSFTEGNIIKYVSRYKKKKGLEDLKKARWYLEHLIEDYQEEVK
ncbi:MAG: DUF3310 domain-containing protein [Candidatus Hodarchaeales archaeon]